MKVRHTPNSRYSLGFKHQVIKEFLTGNFTQTFLEKKHGISKSGSIRLWMRSLGYDSIAIKSAYLDLPIIPTNVSSKKHPSVDNDTKALQKRIKQLERQLEDEQLRSEAFSRMIDITEKDLNITIRKKSDTE